MCREMVLYGIFGIINKFKYILNFTVKYLAEIVNKLCCNALIVPKPMNCTAAYIMVVYKSVCCDTFFFHCRPQRSVNYHNYHQFYYKL